MNTGKAVTVFLGLAASLEGIHGHWWVERAAVAVSVAHFARIKSCRADAAAAAFQSISAPGTAPKRFRSPFVPHILCWPALLPTAPVAWHRYFHKLRCQNCLEGKSVVLTCCNGCLQARSRRSVAGKDIMLDPRAGIRKAGAMGPLMALLKEVTEVCPCLFPHRPTVLFPAFLL